MPLRLALILVLATFSNVHAATKVACVGDSITAGAGSTNAATKSYPPVLATQLGVNYQVTNYGHSGATMLGPGFGDLPYVTQTEYNASSTFQPNIVIIMLGTNDSKPQNWANKTQFEADATAMINHYATLASKPQVYLMLPPPVYNAGNFGITNPVVHDEVIPVLRIVAAKTGTPLIDINTAMSGHPEYFPDNVHPNDAGYNVLATTVYNAITIKTPTALAANAVSDTRVDLTWTDNATNESGFNIERKEVGGSFAKIGTAAADATSYSDTTAVKLTDYVYRVRAANAAGESPASNDASASTPDVPPAAPSALSATTASATQINLAWTDNAANESGFKIERKTGEAGTFEQIATVIANATTFSDTSVSPVTAYTYRVRATNSAGDSAFSAEASATTPDVPPDAPSDLLAVAASGSSVDLSWTDHASNESGFTIERSSDGLSGWTLAGSIAANKTAMRDPGLAAATRYFYRAKATNSAGDSEYSNVAEVTTFSTEGNAAPPPLDSDGDGFSDALELAASTSAQNASDTPTGSAAGTPLLLADEKLAIKLNFAKAGSDSIGLSAALVLPSEFSAAKQRLLVEIGGVAQSFTLDAKAAAKSKTASASIKSKGTAARIGKASIKLSKGDFAATLANAGLANTTGSAKVYVRATLLLGNLFYEGAALVSYKATAGKTGSAK